tara:strand:+ start:195 stop:1118 length:924 start_codon:yes stop_codon:yes gene_type:complete
MGIGKFTTRAYPIKFDPTKPPDDPSLHSATTEEVSDLEVRVSDWTKQLSTGPSGGKMYSDVILNPVAAPYITGADHTTGSAIWEINDNSSLTGVKITVTTTGGISSGVLGTDIPIAATAALTNVNIATYFNGKMGVTAAPIAGTDKIDFRAFQLFAPVGSLVSVDFSAGFGPSPDLGDTWVIPKFSFYTGGTAAKFREGDYIRASHDSEGDKLVEGRMKVLSVDTVANEITLDHLPVGLSGGDYFWAEHDNAIALSRPTEPTYWQIASYSGPSSIWVPSVTGRGVGRSPSNLYLRTTRKTTVDIWVW